MQKLCQTVYGPLYQFCKPLNHAFPGGLVQFQILEDAYKTNTWDLILSFGPSCTKSLLVAALSKNETRFFKDESNEFITFIGGKSLYDLLTPEERDTYWSNEILANIIRQTMVLCALYPMTEKLQTIVEKVMSTTNGKNLTQTDIINTLISDPNMMMSMLSLMDSPESMKVLMTSLKTIVDGMMTVSTDDTFDNEDDDDDETGDDNNKEDEKTDTPSSIFKQEAKKKKRNRRRRKKKSGNNPLSSIIDELSMDDKTIESMTNDIKTMNVDDITSMAKDVSKMLNSATGDNKNGGTADMLTNLMGAMSKMNLPHGCDKGTETKVDDSLVKMMSQLTSGGGNGNEQNPLATMMSQLTSGGGDGNEQNPLATMMGQLTSGGGGGKDGNEQNPSNGIN